MSKTKLLRELRILEPVRGERSSQFVVCTGKNESNFRCFGAAVSQKAAKALRADIRKNPSYYGI